MATANDQDRRDAQGLFHALDIEVKCRCEDILRQTDGEITKCLSCIQIENISWELAKRREDGVIEERARIRGEIRKWWTFNEYQEHTHSWHTREDFIEQKLDGKVK